MELNTNSPEFRAVIETVREVTIRECIKNFSKLKQWVSVKKACEQLDISRSHLNKLIEEGKIKSKHIGKSVRISVNSIEDYTG